MKQLKLTLTTMQAVLKACRIHAPSEACGFVVASREAPTVGVRVMWMDNVHPEPVRHYRMGDAAVVAAMAGFDENAEEPIAVFHSHTGPGAQPLMSPEDIAAAVDPNILHLVIALDPKPIARAWHVRHFIGSASVEGAEIRVVDPPETNALKPAAPVGPWALHPGNHVRINYRSNRKGPIDAPVSVVGTVIGIEEDLIRLNPDLKGGVSVVQSSRIVSVSVIGEGAPAQAARYGARLHARQIALMLDGGDTTAVPALAQRLSILFPSDFGVTMGDS